MSILSDKSAFKAPSRLNRRVLIVTDDVNGSLTMIEYLRGLSLDVAITGYDGETPPELPDRCPSAVLFFLSDFIEHGPRIVASLRARYAPRQFPVIGRLSREAAGDHPYDSVMYDPVHPVQVAHRTSSLIRLGQMEAEIVRRMDTLRESFGQELELAEAPLRRPFRVLFIGKADPAYMAVVNALQDKNVEVVAAFTSFSAFDYLHEGSFEAVVMNGLSGSEPALTIAETMRRNPALFHVPALLLINRETFQEESLAYAHGIKDLIDADAPAAELSGRVLELANDCRLHHRLKSEFTNLGGQECSDPETGVMNNRFLTPHLTRVSRDCRARRVPLSILTMKLVPKVTSALEGNRLADAFAQCIKNIAGVVRMQDIVARVDTDTVIVAFPEERRTDVARVAARITDMIETTTFEALGDTDGSLRMGVQTAIVEQSENFPDAEETKASSDSMEMVG